jgi:hypothetical protein
MSRRVSRPSAAIACVAMLLSHACYAYAPAPVAAAPKTLEQVRIALTPDGVNNLARYLGPGVNVAEGDVSSVREDGTYMVAVKFVHQANGVRQPWMGEGVVAFPAEYRADVQTRVFQRGQSVAAGGALGVALVAVAVAALKVGGAFGGGGVGGPPNP